jgi:molybdopterin converting factor small subunit
MTIKVTCIGHIKTSVGRETVEFERAEMTASELIEALREMGAADPNMGFTKFNTLLVVNGASAFTAAAHDKKLQNGDDVFLLPFSHGG